MSNRTAIGVNSNNILSNSIAIQANTTDIARNSLSINANTAGINGLREGLSAIAALPNLYLNSNENFTIAGGLNLYDDGFGSSEIGFRGGIQFRQSTSDKWSVGVRGGVSSGSYTVGIQGRIGTKIGG